MTKLKLCITPEDIADTERFHVSNPVLYKLQNMAGTSWRLCNDGLAMETAPPFRATLLPSWTLQGWHAESENKRALPCEIELDLYLLQPDCAANDAQPQSAAHPDCVLDYETVQNALLQVLEYNEWSSWRAVCPHIFIERIEPYRSIVLSTDSLHRAQEWLQSLNQPLCFPDKCKCKLGEMTRIEETKLRLPAKLFAPLTSEPIQEITINFPPRTF